MISDFSQTPPKKKKKTSSMDLQSLLNGPAMAPPLGESPNFVNPSNMTTKSDAILTLCLIVSVLAVSMRMWTKTFLIRKVLLEDCIYPFMHHCLGNMRTNYVSGVCCAALVRCSNDIKSVSLTKAELNRSYLRRTMHCA